MNKPKIVSSCDDTYLHGMKRSDGDDDSGASKRRRAVGLQCFNKRFLYSGLNMSIKVLSYGTICRFRGCVDSFVFYFLII